MAQADTGAELASRAETPSFKSDSLVSLAAILLLLSLALLSVYRQHPPAVAPADSNALEFSALRAMKHLEIISRKPHPIGTLEHAAVRDYLLQQLTAQGLSPEVQKTTAVNPVWSGDFRAGATENVLARLQGTANTKAILLVGHYDSVPNGFGASDDGAAVSALLETLRALKAGPALANDVIFLFTDGEEPGLLGAHAFVAEHPWAKDVGLVLNFEARGNSGPSIMFETSNQNGWLIKEFARAAPYPVAHSLAYEIYRLLPNDTDLTVFKRANLPGLNFAYINGLTHYHTQLDNVSEIDRRSLQHHGSYALALARHFGNLDLRNTREGNAIYFDLLGATLVHYSGAWILPLTIVTTLAFVWLLIAGLRNKRLTVRGLVWGFLALFLSIIVAPVIVTLLWSLIMRFKDVAGVRGQGEAYESNLFFISFAALTIAITSALYIYFRKKASVENLTAGGLIVWLIALLLTSFMLPGASYLPTWLMLFSLPALAYLLFSKEQPQRSFKFLLLLMLSALAGIVLLVPVIYQTFIGLTLGLIGGVMLLLVLLLGLFVPHLKLMATPRQWLLPGAMLLIGVGFMGAGLFGSDYDARQPRLDSMLYGLNGETGRAIWASADRRPDEWTTQFMKGGEIQRRPLPEFFSASTTRPFAFIQSATTQALAAPNIALLDDSTKDGVRSLRLRLTSMRQAPVISVYLDSEADVQGLAVNGRRIEPRRAPANQKNPWSVRYYNVPAEGIELALDLKTPQQVRLRVVDQSYGLPDLADKPVSQRPAGLIPANLPFNDSTLVSKSFVF
jgi:hypothetical protein